MRRRAWIPALGVALALAGCAAQKAFRDGRELVAQGRVDEGLAKLQEASADEPGDARYRQAYLLTREHALAAYADQAEQAVGQGRLDQARALYQRALALDPGWPRAREGLAGLDALARRGAELDAADALVARGQLAQAREKLSRVLAEAPADARALALRRALDAQAAPASPESQLAQAYRRPVTVEFKDATLRQVFEVIAHGAGVNFLFDKDVKTDARTSIFLKNSTIEAAVRYVLLTNQLEQQVLDGNTVLVYPNTAAKQKDYQQLDVRTFYLVNAEAKSVAATLKTILKSRDVVVDERLNLLIVRDTPDAIRMAERLVAVQDVPEPEVMLEVEVIEVQRKRLQDLGIQWPGAIGVAPGSPGSLVSGTIAGTGTGSSTPAGVSLYDLLHQTSRSIGVSVGATTANANVVDSDAKLLTNPRIRVKNHEKAKILIGERVPNITSTATSTGFLSQSVNYIDVGLTLNVEPTVYLDDEVGIKVSLEVSSLLNQVQTSSGTTAYQIGTRNAATVLRLKNGETDVLAGLIDSQERTSGNKIPGLGDLPIAGRLFGATTDDDQKTEIVLSITPRLVRNVRLPDAADASFHSGTDGSLHVGPAGAPAATPPFLAPAPAPIPQAVQPPAAPASAPPAPAGADPQASDAGASPAATGAVQLQWQGPSTVAVGGSLVLQVLAQSSRPVASLPLALAFDGTRLRLESVSEGPFLKQAGAATSFSSRLLADGQLALSDVAAGGGGASAPGVFATIVFKALAPTAATQVSMTAGPPAAAGGGALSASAPAPFVVRVGTP